MAVLAIDTSTVVAATAVVKGGAVLSELTWAVPRSHSERILPAVDEVVRMAGLSIRDISLVAVTLGPGSFTGLRIGISLAKGLAEGLNVRVAGVSTLHLLAMQSRLHRGLIIPVLCAQRGQYYAALFEGDGKDVQRLLPDAVADPDEVLSWAAQAEREVLLTGEGAKELGSRSGLYVAPAELRLPRAGLLGLLAESMQGADPGQIAPNYVRSSSAKPRKGADS